MKTKYLIILSLVCFSIMGALAKKPIFAYLYPRIHSIHNLFIARDIPTYAQGSQSIIIGHVDKVSAPYYNQNTIQRDVNIHIDETLKGEVFESITLSILGGEINGDRLIADDEPRFKSGEDVLLFLGVDGEGKKVVFAGPYGKYLIHEDGNVSSAGDFTMPLDELVSQIDDELENGEPLAPPQDKSGILEE